MDEYGLEVFFLKHPTPIEGAMYVLGLKERFLVFGNQRGWPVGKRGSWD